MRVMIEAVEERALTPGLLGEVDSIGLDMEERRCWMDSGSVPPRSPDLESPLVFVSSSVFSLELQERTHFKLTDSSKQALRHVILILCDLQLFHCAVTLGKSLNHSSLNIFICKDTNSWMKISEFP